MEAALILILGFLGPLILVGIIGIIYGIYIMKKERHEEQG